jgi:MFS family permease
VIAHLTDKHARPHVFAWYALTGTFGTALGLITCGWITSLLIDHKHWTRVETYHLVFLVYAGIGVIKLILTLLLSSRCELEKPQDPAVNGETAPLLGNGDDQAAKKKKKNPSMCSMLPQMSRESRAVLVQLCALFALDNFASGLAPM